MGVIPQLSTSQFATWTSATLQNATLQIFTSSYQTALVTSNNAGSITGGVLTFEGYDGFNWYNLTAVEIPGGTNDRTYNLTSGSQAWYIDVTNWASLRVRLSTAISGTGSVLVSANASASNSSNATIRGSATGPQNNVNLDQVGGAAYALGQTTSTGSMPVVIASNQSAIPVSGTVTDTPPLVSTGFNNQQTVTTSAVALATNTLTQGITIEALSTNTVSVFVGFSGVTTSTGLELPPGAAVILPVNNSNAIFVICASSSPVVSWIGV